MNLVTEGRKLVTIRKVLNIEPIPDADAIDVATIDGWKVVVKKGEFNTGDYCVFFEIDSFLPVADPRYAFLAKSGTKEDEFGVERIRLKTVKLKKQISQGLVLPVGLFTSELEEIDFSNGNHPDSFTNKTISVLLEDLENSRDGIELFLNITKYERPEERDSNSGGKAKTAGTFPWWVPKTDSPRLQNMYEKYSQKFQDVDFRPSLKMDGSSTTISFVSDEQYFLENLNDVSYIVNEETREITAVDIPYPFQDENGTIILCSRNLALKYDPSVNFWKAVHNTQIHVKLKQYCIENDRQLSIQAELTGPGVNGNWDRFDDYDLHVFHVWDIVKSEYLDDIEFQELCTKLDITTAKQFDVIKPFYNYSSMNDFLAASDISSVNNEIAEGIVYVSTHKVNGTRLQFKVINNKYLLSEK